MTEKAEYHIPIIENGKTALDYLTQASGLSRQKIKLCMQKGAVWITKNNTTQRLRRAKKLLPLGTELHFYYDPKVINMSTASAILISDEGDYSVWSKPYGMLSQGSKWGDHCTVYRWVAQNLKPERPTFIVHRLDRAATGLIIIAHKKQTATLLSKLFQERHIEKHYRVSVEGKIQDPLTINESINSKRAVSHITPLKYDASTQQTQLDVHIETGRKHQIRKHLSGLGFPVVGDRLYGNKKSTHNLQLSAYSLEFICPVDNIEKKFRLNSL